MNTTEIDTTQWILIPGFLNYKINKETCDIISKSRNKWVLLKKNKKISMTPEVGNRFGTTKIRILYGALHGIDPRDIPRTICIRISKDGEIKAVYKSEINKEIIKKMAYRRNEENIEDKYKEGLCFSNIVLECYRSGEYATLWKEIIGKKTYVYNYLRKRFRIRCETSLESIWTGISELALDNIMSRKAYVPCLNYYLAALCRSYVVKRRKLINNERYIDDIEEYQLKKYR